LALRIFTVPRMDESGRMPGVVSARSSNGNAISFFRHVVHASSVSGVFLAHCPSSIGHSEKCRYDIDGKNAARRRPMR
jgi:hypothetical protein